MSSAVTETEIYEASVIGPDDGDLRNAASVRAGLQDLANRAKWKLARIAEFLGVFKTISAVSTATDTITSAGHGIVLNDPVRFTSVGGSVPGGLTAGTVYYARDITADTFKVAASAGGSAIDITSAGTGTLYAWTVPDAAAYLFAPASGVLPAGSLRGQLTYLKDNFALLGAINTWTAANTFNAAVALVGAVTAADFTMTGVNRVKLASRSLTRAARGNAVSKITGGTPDWDVPVTTRWLNTTVGGSLLIPLDPPDGSTLTSVDVYIDPAAGHGALPATMPSVIVRQIMADGTVNTLATVSDTSGSVGAYEALHPISASGLSHAVARTTSRYSVELKAEAGANSAANTMYVTTTMTYTTTAYED